MASGFLASERSGPTPAVDGQPRISFQADQVRL